MTHRLIAAAGLIVTGLVATAATPLKAEIIEQVLVKVNGEIVSKSDFEKRQVEALGRRPEFANANPSSLELQKAIAEITPDLILEAVDELLMIQRGRELNFALGDAQFKSIVDDIRKQNNLADEAQFQAALKQEGMTMADLRRNIERNMLISQVQSQEVTQKLSATDEEARAYFEAHRSEFTTPAEVMLREILIEVPASDRGVNVAQDDAAKAKAEEIRQRLLKGEPFPRLVAEESAAASKANGGLIGPINLAEVSTSLQQMIDKMKPGDITTPIRTNRGVQILKLETLKPSAIQPFESVRDLVADKVHDSRQQTEVRKFLSKVRGQALIEWKNEELKKLYEKQVAVESGGGAD